MNYSSIFSLLALTTSTIAIIPQQVSAADIAPTPALVAKSRGYTNKHFNFKSIRYDDGIGQAEASTIAEFQILGAIDFKRLPVQSYEQPKKDGDFWRIDVFIKTPKGLKNQPLFVDSINGESHGTGWYRNGGGEITIGATSYRIVRQKGLFVEMKPCPMAREICRSQAVSAIAKIERDFPGKFEKVSLNKVSTAELILADEVRKLTVRQWQVKFPLTKKV
jgi:hypothetical protein